MPWELKSIEDWTVQETLKSVLDIVDVSSFGASNRACRVRIDPDNLIAYGLSLAQAEQQIAGNRYPSASLLMGFASGAYLSRFWQPQGSRSVGDAAPPASESAWAAPSVQGFSKNTFRTCFGPSGKGRHKNRIARDRRRPALTWPGS
jgi:hypothetical protein